MLCWYLVGNAVSQGLPLYTCFFFFFEHLPSLCTVSGGPNNILGVHHCRPTKECQNDLTYYDIVGVTLSSVFVVRCLASVSRLRHICGYASLRLCLSIPRGGQPGVKVHCGNASLSCWKLRFHLVFGGLGSMASLLQRLCVVSSVFNVIFQFRESVIELDF